MRFKYSKSERAENVYQIGKTKNFSQTVNKMNIDLYGNKDDLLDLNISLQVGDRNYSLFENYESKTAIVDIYANFEDDISLYINPKSDINYDRYFTLQIKPVVLD